VDIVLYIKTFRFCVTLTLQFLHVVLVLSVVEKIMADGSGPLNPHLAGSILRAAQCYVACGDNMNEKNLLTLSQAKPN